MDEDGFVRVAASAEVAGPPYLRVTVGGTDVLVARLADGSLRAFSPRCPHLRQPLTRAIVTGTTLECPFHFYAYDLDTGANTFPGDDTDLALPLHDVVERDGAVFVRLRPDVPRGPDVADGPRVPVTRWRRPPGRSAGRRTTRPDRG